MDLSISQPKSRFAAPRWTPNSPAWQALDRNLEADHTARVVAALVAELDLSELEDLDRGVGSKAHRPEWLLKIALYETLEGNLSPAAWARHAREHNPVQWLAMGVQPSRSAMYHVRDRLGFVIKDLVADLLGIAQDEGFVRGQQGVLDGTAIRAQASRHRLLNQARLDKRLEALKRAVAGEAADQPMSEPPAWMATTAQGRRPQLQRYLQAEAVLRRRLAENAKRPADSRLAPEKVVVSVSDPEAPAGRDKEKVFGPLYTVQFVIEPCSWWVLSFDVFAQASDAGALPPMLDETRRMLGRALETAITDAGYVSILDLQACQQRPVEWIAPVQENDYTRGKAKDPTNDKAKGHTKAPSEPPIGKDQFTWHAQEQTYHCPQGHSLHYTRQRREPRRHGESVVIHHYQCPATHCQQCPLKSRCVKDPSKGRIVTRTEGEELLEAHRLKMATPQAQQLRKLRGQVIERGFGDAKQHRNLRRLHGRGVHRAKAEVGLVVLAQNILRLHRLRQKAVKSVEVAA
jgi:transposase